MQRAWCYRYEQLTANSVDENLGPAEATLYNMKRELEAAQQQREELQRRWLKRQRRLVDVTSQTEEAQVKVRALTAELTVVEQQQRRAESAVGAQGAEVRDAEARSQRGGEIRWARHVTW